MLHPLPKLAAFICCFTLAACGGDDSTVHATLIDESVAALNMAVGFLASADDSVSAKNADAELKKLSQQLGDLSNRAAKLRSAPDDQRGAFVVKFRNEFEPAMGKLHAASLAALGHQVTVPTLGERLQTLESEAAEIHRTLAESLGIK